MTEPLMMAVKGSWLTLPRQGLNPQIVRGMTTYEYASGKRVCEAEEVGDHWVLPRELFSDEDLNQLGYEVHRLEQEYRPAFAGCSRKLSPEYSNTELQRRIQYQVLDVLEECSGGGVIQLPPGSGKTALTLMLAQRLQVPALVAVTTKDIQRQWLDRAESLLGLPVENMALIGGYATKTTGSLARIRASDLILATVQSLHSNPGLQQLLNEIVGLTVFDEVHHMQGAKYRHALSIGRGFRLGLSATVDVGGLEQLFLNHLGPILFSSEETDLTPEMTFVPVLAQLADKSLGRIERPTFINWQKLRDEWLEQGHDLAGIESMLAERQRAQIENSRLARTLTEVGENLRALDAVVSRVKECALEGRTQLVLSDRVAQLKLIHAALGEDQASLLLGETKSDVRAGALTSRNIVCASTSLAVEALDRTEFDTLHICLPWAGLRRFVQGTGRILRANPKKISPARVFAYDFRDLPMLHNMSEKFRSLCRRYSYPMHELKLVEEVRNG